jgi:hypothetical protein
LYLAASKAGGQASSGCVFHIASPAAFLSFAFHKRQHQGDCGTTCGNHAGDPHRIGKCSWYVFWNAVNGKDCYDDTDGNFNKENALPAECGGKKTAERRPGAGRDGNSDRTYAQTFSSVCWEIVSRQIIGKRLDFLLFRLAAPHPEDKFPIRYGQLKNQIPHISHRILSQELKYLEMDGLIQTISYLSIPKVEYIFFYK